MGASSSPLSTKASIAMMAEGQKSTQYRGAFALACGLAICCAVMYVTADGAESVLVESYGADLAHKYVDIKHVDKHSAMAGTSELGAVKGLRSANVAQATATGTELKVESVDVKKVGVIYTDDTPDGKTKLMDYFKKVEKQIATEVAGRKADIASIRTQMAKNRAYNAKARASMKHMLLTRMAANAKKAKADLDKQMRITARNFAKAAALENKRQRATMRRAKKTREIMRKNKKENAHNLHMAVLNQQRALSALDSATNARIKKTNQHIAANAAQIKANAIKARKDLDAAMDRFDKKMYNVNEEAKKGRSKLASDAAAMDKKVRAMINGKIKKQTAFAAQEFQKVRATMAKDRHDADMALAHTTTKMTSALAAAKALQDKRFAQSVADIASAKKEANDRVESFKKSFKMDIMHLSSVVTEHVAKLNARQTTLEGTVASNKLEQAKVNDAVSKELKNMVKIGNDREAQIAKDDQALKDVMAANKEDTQKKMDKMSQEFYLQLSKIRAQMKKDRKYQEGRLGKSTSALFETLAKNKKMQDQKNEQLTAATRQARLDADNALREAKHGFANRLGALHTIVVKNDKKAEKKIAALTGVVAANAVKDAEGRRLLKMQSKANALELKNAIRDAVNKGEARARQIEKMAKDMNKKTRDALNQRISTEIGALTKETHSSIEKLNMQSKEARAQMKGEILYALRSESELLKKQLGDAVKWANKKFVALDEQLASEKETSEAARAHLKSTIDSEKALAIEAIQDAVAAQASGLMALKTETETKIKKTNVGALGNAVVKHAEEVAATMAGNTKTITDKIDAGTAARHEDALNAVKTGLADAKKRNDEKFHNVYEHMGKDRAKFDEALAAATTALNDKLAAHAALEDARFAGTVKNLAAAKAKTWEEVQEARKFFTMGFIDTVAAAKGTETRIIGEIEKVAHMVIEESATQGRINAEVDKELERIFKLSNARNTENVKARAKIKELMDKNKVVAAQEVADLRDSSEKELQKLRAYQAKLRREVAHDLTGAVEDVYEELGRQKLEQAEALQSLTTTQRLAVAGTSAALKSAEENFRTRFGILVDVVASNNKKVEDKLEEMTKVAHDWNVSSAADRALIRKEAEAMNIDLNKAIVKAIQIGEAKSQEVLDRGMTNVNAMGRAMMVEIAEQVERMADNVLKTVSEDHQTMANNYLSLKGYAGAGQDTILEYIQKGGGSRKGLNSIGDFLQSVAVVADVKTKPAEGVSAGAGELIAPFSGSIVPEVKEINKVNGLCDEYMQVYAAVRARWPYGIGKYMLVKLADSMTKEGVLRVGSKSGSSGQWVMMNAKTLGLSNKLDEFESIAVRITHYQDFLDKLSAKLPHKKIVAPYSVPPPEYQGD